MHICVQIQSGIFKKGSKPRNFFSNFAWKVPKGTKNWCIFWHFSEQNLSFFGQESTWLKTYSGFNYYWPCRECFAPNCKKINKAPSVKIIVICSDSHIKRGYLEQFVAWVYTATDFYHIVIFNDTFIAVN